MDLGTDPSDSDTDDDGVSDGAEGAQYLQAFKNLIENPMRLLI